MLYHDWEASTYDEKWSISYDERCIDYARDRFVHVAGDERLAVRPTRWSWAAAPASSCSTSSRPGSSTEGHVTDISPGHGRGGQRNGRELGFDVEGRVADAESMPYADDAFDLVVGHAVLHHIPDVELALREVLRVLGPAAGSSSPGSRRGGATGWRAGCPG